MKFNQIRKITVFKDYEIIYHSLIVESKRMLHLRNFKHRFLLCSIYFFSKGIVKNLYKTITLKMLMKNITISFAFYIKTSFGSKKGALSWQHSSAFCWGQYISPLGTISITITWRTIRGSLRCVSNFTRTLYMDLRIPRVLHVFFRCWLFPIQFFDYLFLTFFFNKNQTQFSR